jgi:hypothetical protein
MGFVTPWFLAGLLAVGLPLWLHLLERQNPVRVLFSSLMFFERRTQRPIRHRRLRYLLLLASRLALLSLLALAFARPVLERPPAAALGSPRNRIVAVDSSLSMNYQGRWARARAEAMGLVEKLGAGGRARVLAFGPGVRILTDLTDDRTALRSAVASLAPTSSRNSYGELGQSLRSLAQNTPEGVEVHVISDFQQSAMPGRFADLSLPATASLVVHNVAEGDSGNWCVESVKGTSRLYEKQPPRLEVTVAGFNTPAAARRVTLAINGRQVASQPASVPEAGRATVEFTGFEVPYGHSRAEVRIDSADPLAADDSRLFSFERADPLPILFLQEPGRKREALYFRTALASTGQSPFTLREATPVEAASLAVERFAFVVLADVPRLPSLLEQRLKSYGEAGGGVLLIMGPSIALSGEAPLLKRRVSDVRYTAREQERFQQVAHADSTHAALRGSRRFAGVKFFRYARWEAPTEAVLARLSDGSPLLVEEPLGAGRLLVLTSTPDNIWNDLPVHPLFVPFVTESARYLSGIDEGEAQATVDSILELQKRRDPRSTVEALDPAGRRALTLAEAVSSRDLVLSSIGFYEIRRPGQVTLVAVNADSRESDLRPIPDDALAMWRSTGRTEAGATSATSPKPAPRDLWRIVLFVAFLAAVIESVLGNVHLNLRREVQSE